MRVDLLEKWLKMFPYAYCDGVNFQSCRASNNTDCPYSAYNVHCSDGHAALAYYWELLRFKKMKPRKARKITIMFAKTLPSIMQTLDKELAERQAITEVTE